MRTFLGRRAKKASKEAAWSDAIRILSGYVLHLSITSLGDGDIEPLYEEYMSDPRLGAPERQELTNAFEMLRSRAAAAT